MKRFLKRIHQGNKGFTLIELLIVIAIIGVLAAVIVPNVTTFIGRGEETAARAELAAVQTAMDLAIVDNMITEVTEQTEIDDFSSAGEGEIATIDDDEVYLYPTYLRVKLTSALREDGVEVATYSWTDAGLVSSTAFDADGVWQ